MKKFLRFLFLLSVLLISSTCDEVGYKNVYEKTYTDEQVAVKDIYTQFKIFKVDSVPLENWMHEMYITDTITVMEKIFINYVDAKTQYTFTYIIYEYPSNTSYQFTIRYKGKL